MSTTLNESLTTDANDNSGSAGFGLLGGTIDYAGKIGASVLRSFYRFPSIAMLKNSTIVSATFSVVAVDTDATSTWSTKIHGNAADNPSAPASGSALDALALTTAFTAPTTSLSTTSLTRYNFDVTSIIQELVNRAGWASGNAIMFVWVDNSSSSNVNRRWSDSSGGGGNNPKLDITFNDPVTGKLIRVVLEHGVAL